MAAETVTIIKTGPVVKTKVATFTPQDLAQKEAKDPSYAETWFGVYVPWHRDDEWWQQYAEQKLQMDAENALLWTQPHRKLMLTIAAGLFLGFAFSRLL